MASSDVARYPSYGSGCVDHIWGRRSDCVAVKVTSFTFCPTILFLSVSPSLRLLVLYSSVGHAGASGYIATLTLFGLSPASIKPTALILNILVACIGTYQFWRAGHFSWNLFWPFAILSVPFAFLGGYLIVPAHVLRVIVGGVLLCSALRLSFSRRDPENVHAPHLTTAIPVGAGIGFLSGITGTGGGIFLTPMLLFFRWTHIKPLLQSQLCSFC